MVDLFTPPHSVLKVIIAQRGASMSIANVKSMGLKLSDEAIRPPKAGAVTEGSTPTALSTAMYSSLLSPAILERRGSAAIIPRLEEASSKITPARNS